MKLNPFRHKRTKESSLSDRPADFHLPSWERPLVIAPMPEQKNAAEIVAGAAIRESVTTELPPFVTEDSETGGLRIKLKDLPDTVTQAILKDNSLEEGPREWYLLRQGITALHFVRQEVEDGSEKAAAQLEGDWYRDMPDGWEEYIQLHLADL